MFTICENELFMRRRLRGILCLRLKICTFYGIFIPYLLVGLYMSFVLVIYLLSCRRRL